VAGTQVFGQAGLIGESLAIEAGRRGVQLLLLLTELGQVQPLGGAGRFLLGTRHGAIPLGHKRGEAMGSTSRHSRLRRLRRLSRGPLTAFTIRTARQFLREYPDEEEAWLILGRALSDADRCEEAEQAFAKAIEFAPPHGAAAPYAHMASLFEGSGNLSEAAAWYGRAIKAATHVATYHNGMGWLLARQGRLHDAERCFRIASECELGGVEEALFSLGLVLRSQERFEEAVDCFRQVLLADPEHRPARHALRDVQKCLGTTEGG
jgi:Tfp pilus assembly protein PilF